MDNQFDHIWNRFLKRLEAEINRTSQADVARLLGVNRGQVSKWLSGLQVGGNLKTFVTHMDKLGISFDYLINPEITDTRPLQAPVKWKPSTFEKHLSDTLFSGAKLLGKKTENICTKAYGNADEKTLDNVSAMLKGKSPIGVEDFHKLCSAIGLPPADVLNRAAELTTMEIGEETTRRTA